jgi:predicted RNA-binding Zn-ribbon protein involved in translation (DUF1610 family)
MNAVYVVWVIEDACPNCTGVLTEIGLEGGSVTQECRSCGWAVCWRCDSPGGDR